MYQFSGQPGPSSNRQNKHARGRPPCKQCHRGHYRRHTTRVNPPLVSLAEPQLRCVGGLRFGFRLSYHRGARSFCQRRPHGNEVMPPPPGGEVATVGAIHTPRTKSDRVGMNRNRGSGTDGYETHKGHRSPRLTELALRSVEGLRWTAVQLPATSQSTPIKTQKWTAWEYPLIEQVASS